MYSVRPRWWDKLLDTVVCGWVVYAVCNIIYDWLTHTHTQLHNTSLVHFIRANSSRSVQLSIQHKSNETLFLGWCKSTKIRMLDQSPTSTMVQWFYYSPSQEDENARCRWKLDTVCVSTKRNKNSRRGRHKTSEWRSPSTSMECMANYYTEHIREVAITTHDQGG